MPLGLSRGVDKESFLRLVKSMRLVVITGDGRQEFDLPLEAFDVPIFNFKVTVEPHVARMSL